MADKTINVKIREAYDTEQNWRQNDPVLYSGQLAISSDRHGMYKVGNGTATWSELDYASHPAQDVSSWAKESTKPTYTISEISDADTLITNMTRTNITDALGYTPIGEGNYVIQVDHGGTGKTTANEAANVFINALTDDQTKPVDSDYFISQYVNGHTTTTTYHRRPLSALWDYIKDKSDAAYLAINGTAAKATILEQNRTIDGVAFNGSANVTHYGVCTTEAETAEKAVACNNFSLDTGSVITVKFTTTNTAQSDVTLNVNSTGAKSIKYRNSVAPSSSLFVAGRTYQFVYDGESYQLIGDIDTNIDTKVMQSLSTEDVDYPVLFSYANKNDTAADINNGSYRNNSIYVNPQTGTLTATTLKGYLDGNAKSATVSSFLNPTDSNTTYGSSTERGTITDGVVVFGESFRNTVDFVNEDESMISDSGDITMWMKQEADDDVRLNMSIDGDYYAHKDQPIAKLSEVVTLNGDQTVLGYKTFPGATFTNDTRWETGNYGFMIRNDGESTWFLLTAEGDPTGSWETPHPIRIKHDNHEVYFGSPVTAHQGITGSLTGHASLDVPISTGFGQNLSNYASSDDNAISGTVVRYSNGQATGKPTGTDHALFQMAYSDIWKTQLAQDWRTNKAYIRSCNNGTWGDWAELYKIGDQLSSDLLFANSGTSTRQIRGIVGDNDYWRIAGGATASNAGWMEVATADDGNEPIYVRQYTGAYTTVKRTATLLDANGNTLFPNRLYVGTESDTQEQQIVCRSSAGTIYLYSQNGQGNNRGLYCPAHGSGSAIGVLSINTNNQPTYSGYLNRETYQPTSASSWGIPFCSRYNRNEISINGSLWYHFRAGSSASSTGYAILQLGNNIVESSANGTRGRLRIFGNNTGYSDLYTNVTTKSKSIYLPARGGTIFTTEMFSLSGTTLTISTS